MTTTICFTTIDSPLGQLFVEGDGQFVTGLYLPQHKGWQGPGGAGQRSDDAFDAVRRQLTEYFAGRRQTFELPLRPSGTPFQQLVWRHLEQIPFGATISYSQLAQRIGKPSASRAVGNANSRNPISIIVPCHRVIGADGKLTGYAGGEDKKRWLLDWERSTSVGNVET